MVLAVILFTCTSEANTESQCAILFINMTKLALYAYSKQCTEPPPEENATPGSDHAILPITT